MKISSNKAVSNIGQRENNEDSYLIIGDKNIFMVCDGVGGSAKGEVASKLCCDSFLQYFNHNNIVFPTATDIQQALLYTEDRFADHLKNNAAAEGMGTTLTFLAVNDKAQALIAHIGDSRVHHIRDGKILFVTTDHSLVAEMVASGFISEEEALTHPKKNAITRAVQGSVNPTNADIHFVDNILPGDYFLLCTDGILESVKPEFIEQEFTASNSIDIIVKKIERICLQNSKDNFTAVVVQYTAPIVGQVVTENLPVEEERVTAIPKKPLSRKKLLIGLILLLAIGSFSFFYFSSKKISEQTKPFVKPDSTNKSIKEPSTVSSKKTPDDSSKVHKKTDSVNLGHHVTDSSNRQSPVASSKLKAVGDTTPKKNTKENPPTQDSTHLKLMKTLKENNPGPSSKDSQNKTSGKALPPGGKR